MNIRADYCERYFRKFFYIFLACLAWSLYCLYDAWIAYPANLVRANVYYSEFADLGDDRARAWIARTEQEGWSSDVPKEPAKIENDIIAQYVQIAICMAIGIPMLLKYLWARGSYIEANEREIKPSWTGAVPFAEIEKIDKTRWERKGVAKLHYKTGNQSSIFTMDDFKFERQPMAKIMAFAEKDLPDAAIIGGPREELRWTQDSSGNWQVEAN